MDQVEPRPQPFFQNGRIKFTFMKNPFAWVSSSKLEPNMTNPGITVVRLSLKNGEEVQSKDEFWGGVEGVEAKSGTCWFWKVQPGSFHPVALILAEPVDRSDEGIKIFELEAKRWSACFPQTCVFDPKTPRQAIYQQSTGAKATFTITTHCKLQFAADNESNFVGKAEDFEGRKPPSKPPLINAVTPVINGENAEEMTKGLTNEWAPEIRALAWTGSEKERLPGQAIPYNPVEGADADDPHMRVYYNIAPFSTTFFERKGLGSYKLVKTTGHNFFKTWFMLSRSPLDGDDVTVDQKLNASNSKSTETPAQRAKSCVVPVAFFDWEVSYGADFIYPDGSIYPTAVPTPGSFYIKPVKPFNEGENWREFQPCSHIGEIYNPFDMSDPNAWQKFPDIRYVSTLPKFIFAHVEQQTTTGPVLKDYFVENQDNDDVYIQPRPASGQPWVIKDGSGDITNDCVLTMTYVQYKASRKKVEGQN